MNKWIVHKADDKLAAEFGKKCDLSLLTLRLMTARGFCDFQQIVDFFSAEEFEDPFLTADMRQAVDVINEYIDSYRLICVYGDYDCDGVTATALLFNYMQSMGANVMYYINEREDGYGMTLDAVRRLNEKGVELIITVDNGISCLAEAEEIYKLGMKLVITDHHQPPEILPKAEAIIDPHRADCPSFFKDMAGVGVAMKLCAALDGGDYSAVSEQYADICSIGTVADIVPLCGENRIIVRKGLMYLKNSENYGLNALMDTSGTSRNKLTSSALAFKICPRINAAGRFASPLLALKALLSEDSDEAEEYVSQLAALNDKRRQTEQEIMAQIDDYINSNPQILNQRVMILTGDNWHHGVIGIVSARILEKYGKPNIILSVDGAGIARGSARSIKGFNIHSCLTYASDFLDKFGGHECAGGLSLKKEYIPYFTERVNEFAAQKQLMPAALTECDMTISPDDLTIENIRSLDVLEPYGAGNAQPLFYMPHCRVNAVYSLSEGKHSKIDISYGGKRLQALLFFKAPQDLFFDIGDNIDIAANIEINEYQGKQSLAVKAADIIPCGMDTDKYFAAKDSYEKLVNGISLPQNFLRKIIPARDELVYVYKLVSRYKIINIDNLFMKINHPAINYCKLRIIFDVFCEAGLAELLPAEQSLRLLKPTHKADLQSTETMRRLNAMLG